MKFDNGLGTFNALRAIAKDEELTVAYIDPNLPTAQRRAFLYRAYGYQCHCERCVPE